MLVFLLGSNRQNNQVKQLADEIVLLFAFVLFCLFRADGVFQQNRRWSSAQAREFLHLHSTLAFITLQCDLGSQRTHGESRRSS